MTRTAVFRADASPTLGGGHVMRCLALADGLASAGWRSKFWVAPGTQETIPALARSSHDVVVGKVPAEGVDLLIVDHYSLDAEFETACRPWARRILAIDDLADRRHECDLLLDQTLGRTAAAYTELTSPDCTYLLGPKYALLRPEFSRLRMEALARRNGTVKRILVSLGGSDPQDMTTLALDALELADFHGVVDVVLGSASPNCDCVARRLLRWPGARLHVDTPSMGMLMAEADIAIGAAGVTSWERCTLGLPCAMVVTADNQRLIAQALSDAGAAVLVGDWMTATAQRLVDALQRMSEPRHLARMASIAGTVCDGHGVAHAIAMVEGML